MGPATANLQLTITPDLKDPAFKLPSGQVFSLTELTRCLSAVFAFAYLLDDVLKSSPSAAISCVSEIFKKRLQLESIPSPLAPSHSNDLFRDANLVSVLTPLVDDEKT